MISKEIIDDLKNDYSFEEIQRIDESIESIEKGNTISHDEMKIFISNELFSKYKINA